MSKHTPLLFYFLFIFISLNAQNQIEEKYRDYFQYPREVVYLHVSKDIFLPEEEIWFKGYLYDQKNAKPSKISKTINVGVYDSTGVLKKEQLYYLNDGFFKGSVKVDSTFADGRYFLKAKTNWMRNFSDGNAFLKEIKVVKSDLDVTQDRLNFESLDIRFFPEGGKMVSGIKNTVGVKVVNGKGLPVEVGNLRIEDGSGIQMASIEVNNQGLGKFEITPNPRSDYFAKIRVSSGEEVSFKLPRSNAKGINLNVVDNPYKKEVLVQVEANELAMKDGDVRTNLVLHKDGEIISQPVLLTKNGKVFSTYFDKTKLMTGVNTLTLFDMDNKPIEERQFFVWKGLGEYKIETAIGNSSRANDSLEITITSKVPEAVGLSVSVFPMDTKVYKGDGNMYNQIYLRPYVKEDIQNDGYYFNDTNYQKKYEMDLLLLTEGHSKYDWHAILKDRFETKYNPVDGINLYGFLNEDLKREKILVHKTIEHELKEIDLSSGQDKFLITNFYPITGESIFFSKIDVRGKISKLNMYARLSNNYFLDENIDVSDHKKNAFPKTNISTIKEGSKGFKLPDISSEEKLIALDNVTITEESKMEKQARENIRVPRYLAKKITVVDKEMALTFNTVAELLRSKGYEVREDLQAFDGGSNAFISRFRIRSRRGAGVNMFLDGALQVNLDVFTHMPLVQVESFYIDRLSRYMGAKGGFRETIYIFTRRGKELNLTPGQDFMSRKSFEFKVDKGFEKQKNFYNPEFTSFTDTAFQNFGLIHWEPWIWIDEDDSYTLKIPNYGFDNLKLVIEGMGKNGNVLSEIRVLNVGDSN
ncbi:hypothetical protein [Flagellimonas oceanensis]|uniref:hypothetical protein n=2 Tax=Flagellimonas oceanensis TaxID=2499163 RepID=UPI003BA955A0